MLINSYEFLVFFAIAFGLYWTVPRRWKAPFLLIASYGFYGSWEPRFLLLIALATAVDYSVGRCLRLTWQSARSPEASPEAPGADPPSPAERPAWGRRLGLYLGAIALAAWALPWPSHPALLFASKSQTGLTQAWLAMLLTVGAFGLLGWLLGSILPHWAIAQSRPADTQRQRLLLLSLVTNLSILGCFKYFNFFVDSLSGLLAGLGWSVALPHWQLLMPIGISFYSFKTLGYVIDCYRGKQEATEDLVHYGVFLAFFPALLAGPIDRASSFLAQLQQRPQFTLGRLGDGLVLILIGLMKKVAIADGLAPSVSAIYQGSGTPSGPDVVVATVLYALQIYGDFSGYTDMARGVAKLLGFELALNFNLPYFSQNPSEFWRRWHISLSTWLRDYLYIPLGGNRKGSLRTYANLMITMVLGGLWHGATWNFGLWGAYQGAILCIHRWWGLRTQTQSPSPASSALTPVLTPALTRSSGRFASGWAGGFDLQALWRIPLFFVVTCYGWLLFGVADFGRIASLSQTLFTGWGDGSLAVPQPPLASLLGIGLLMGYETLEYLCQTTDLYRKLWPLGQGIFYASLIFVLLMGSSNAPAQFIYTQF